MIQSLRRRVAHLRRPHGVGVAVGALLAVVVGVAAFAYWSSIGTGTSSSAVAATLVAPTGVGGVPVNSSVTVSFTGVTAPGGGAVTGYYVTRTTGGVSSNACGTSPTTPTYLAATATGCTDTAVPNGTYTYTVTAIYNSWTATSAASGSVVVNGDTTPPTQVVTLASGSGTAYASGGTVYYNGSAAGSFTLSDAVTDSGSGPKSALFAAIGTTGWTHNAETVTTGTGTAPTITYTSSAFSWTASPTNPSGLTVTGSDAVGNTTPTALIFASDTTGPTGGALTVNGTAGTAGGATGLSTTGTYTGTFTNYGTDAASGLASSVLTRAVGTLSNGVCSGYGTATTIASISESAVATGCYKYTLTGTDHVGNASVLTTVIEVDKTAPTQVLSVSGSSTASLSGSTIYYRSGVTGSFTLNDAVTDAASGPASAAFPLVGGGLSHAAETVTTGTGSAPTVTYASSLFSWFANPTNPGSYTVTGADVAGNTVAGALTFVPDNTGPTGGALTVNGVAATTGTTTGYSSTGTFTGTRTDYNADAGAGVASSVLTREVGTLSNGICSGYAAPTTVSGAPNESGLATGCYRYTLTGTDAAGNTSSVVTVIEVDTTAPTQVLSQASGTNASLTGTTLYYRPGVAGSFTLNDAVTDGQTGPASAAYPAIATTGWTHNAETVTTGTGTVPTITYPSSTFSWTATPSAPSAYTITGADLAGETVGTPLTFTTDTTAPTGGALVVNGVTASAGGATGYSATGTFTGTRTDYSADTGSGVASSVLTREVGTLSNGVCSAYGAATTVAGAPSESALATGCYRYTLTGTDKVGNSTALVTVIEVDRTAPTQALTLASAGGDAVLTGSTVYYQSSLPGAFTLSDAVTDAQSGPASAAYPAIGTTGWTHNAETVTTGTGTMPTITYPSSTFSWTAAPTNPGTYTTTGADLAGNTVGTGLTFTQDNTGPTGGALTVNGVVATAGGATGYSTTGTFTGTRTDYSADTGSGFASSVLTREAGTFSNGVCSAYAAATTVVGAPSETALATGCYRYTLTGTDKVGNTSVLVSVIEVDRSTPTQALSSTSSGGTAYLNGTTLYYKSTAAGSFTLNDAVTDGQSGPKSAAFPAIGTTGWTHNAETVTTGTGTVPTITYPSSTFSWTANPTNPATYTTTATDLAGNTGTSAITFATDNVAPTGGALTVNGAAATTGGSTGYDTDGTFTGTRTDFTDAGSGIASSVLTRQVGTLTNGVCSAYGTATTVTGAPSESGLTTGCYKYTLTGTDNVGNTTSISTVIEVDTTAPTQVVTLTSADPDAVLSGSNVYYQSSAAGTFTLKDAVTDGASGPASAAYPAIGTTGWTHNAETVTTGTGAAPTTTYTSSAFSWTAGANNPAAYTVTGADLAGNTTGTPLTFVPDNTGPTGGALTVNGVAGTAGTATGYSKTGTYTGTFTNFNADAGAGFASSALTRAYAATLTNGVCGTYAAPTTIASISETTVAAGCYKYTLTGTDVLGNTSVLTTVIEVDKTVPSAQTLTDTSANSYLTGTTIYYKGNAAGSLTLTDTVTDGQSGPGSALFPDIATTGWTHPAETVTSGTGADPTIAYTSSTYSWTANPTNPTGTGRTVTGSDLAGNTIATTPTFTSDTTSPTGGALTVNAVAATAAGSTSSTNATTWTIGTRTDYNADTGSGFASSVLTVQTATWSGTTCGTFGTATVITGKPAQTGVGGNCYQYVLTGTDKVGNVSTLTTTVHTGIVVSSVALNDGNGVNVGALDMGDTMVVQFSGPIAVNSVCSTWSGDTTNQSITADNVVTVTAHNGGTANDYVDMATTSAACGGNINFGTVTLGNNGYLVSTASQTFGGAGTQASTIAYNASTYTLTVTLGYNETTPGVLGSNTVTANTIATYTPDTGITGVGGVTITGTGTTANREQF